MLSGAPLILPVRPSSPETLQHFQIIIFIQIHYGVSKSTAKETNQIMSCFHLSAKQSFERNSLFILSLLVRDKYVYAFMYYSYREAMPMRFVNVLTLFNCLLAEKHNVDVSYGY